MNRGRQDERGYADRRRVPVLPPSHRRPENVAGEARCCRIRFQFVVGK
jgi:hypothetical protein